ncbi:uncharacterized protein LOC21403692 [Morus notabilis]|nr:uncharacterized protein LOC21403692 [Morus notabilis]
MTSKNDFVLYSPLPPNPTATAYHQNVVVLPYYRPSPSKRRSRRLCRCLLASAAVLLLIAAVFILYPSDPSLQLVRVHLNRVRVNSSPDLTLDLSFFLTVKVFNRDFFSLDYDSLAVSVGYRGRELGFVNSDGGKIRARGSSYVDATLDLNGFAIIQDVFYLLEDLARGVIPFDTVTKVEGNLGLFLFKIPLKASVSCEVYVNTNNQTIARQDCYPE